MNQGKNWMIAAAVLYAVSFVLPTARGPDNQPALGYEAFSVTFHAVAGGLNPSHPGWWIAASAWVANPLIWLALLAAMLNATRLSAILSASAVAAALPILFTILLPSEFFYFPGYWVWISPAVLLLVAGLRSWNPETGASHPTADRVT